MPRTISTALALFIIPYFALLSGRPQQNMEQVTAPSTTDALLREAFPNQKAHKLERVKTSGHDISRWVTLALGVPSFNRNSSFTIITLILNISCFVAVYDATYTLPHHHKAFDLSFARAGYVSAETARILVREPHIHGRYASKGAYRVSWSKDGLQLQGKECDIDDLAVWHSIQVEGFSEHNDYTVSIVLEGLDPRTKYCFNTTGNHSGTFTTAPEHGGSGTFTFLTSSCIKQRVPYNPLSHPLEIPGFKTLGKLLPELKAQFMLFLGDFIYIDVPMRPGRDVESYRTMYRQVYSEASGWPLVGKHLPWIHVLDDHEIANDWDQGDDGLYKAAIDPFHIYQHGVNPPPLRPNATYYSFNWGPASFFMLDTRRYRSPNDVKDGPSKTMLGTAQLDDLLKWLDHGDSMIRWKFIVSSVPMTKNWRVNGKDTWRGFQWERAKILSAAWGVETAAVIVLSGDRHEFAATAFPPPPSSGRPDSATVYEFSCSPLSQFYLPVRTYKQSDDQDVLLKYIPDGNSKFGAVEIDTISPSQSILKYKLFVDGKQVWNWTLTAPSSS